jgi:hypothetical protein
VEITFTRHAKNRIKLYRIDRVELIRKVETINVKALPLLEKRAFLLEGIRSKIGTAIKVVLIKKRDKILVWTNYPIGKGKIGKGKKRK